MRKIITIVLCATMAVCNTLNAQENMEKKEKLPFEFVDVRTVKTITVIHSVWSMPMPSQRIKRGR